MGWIELDDGAPGPIRVKVVVQIHHDGRRWEARHGEYVAWSQDPAHAEEQVTSMVRSDLQSRFDVTPWQQASPARSGGGLAVHRN